jgi:hypothetical protein
MRHFVVLLTLWPAVAASLAPSHRYALQFGLPVDPGFGPRYKIAPVGRK